MCKSNPYNIYIAQPFWCKMNISRDLVRQIYREYLGSQNMVILSRSKAIAYIRPIVEKLQQELLNWITSSGTTETIKSLYDIFDKCFALYIEEKKIRLQMVKQNIRYEDILNQYSYNRNIAINVMNSVNLWLENAVLHQKSAKYTETSESHLYYDQLFIKLYLYGLSSKTLSLLSLSKKFGEKELFYGIRVSLEQDEPIDVLRDHPVIYYNPAIAGNQDVFKLSADDYKHCDSSSFGIGFQKEYGLSLLLSMKLLTSFQKKLLKRGKHPYKIIDKSYFFKLIKKYSYGKMDPQQFYNTFALTKEKISSQLRNNESIVWLMGTNAYRHELCPFICLNNKIIISYCALEQSKNIWLSYFANGGMIYTTQKDHLTAAIEQRNSELSEILVEKIKNLLNIQYQADFDGINIKYDVIFGHQSLDYGDYDIVFYTKDTNELFLVEAKFFSDSLNNSGMINDYQKIFEKNGYYDHCKNRYNLVIREAQAMKDFIGATDDINVHFLFVSSKPLEIEFTDKDGIVSFPCFSILEDYLKGNLISEDGSSIIRPSITI